MHVMCSAAYNCVGAGVIIKRLLFSALYLVLPCVVQVSFIPCDITDEEGLEFVLLNVDHAIQYGEDMEPKEPPADDEADERLERIREMQGQRGGGESGLGSYGADEG